MNRIPETRSGKAIEKLKKVMNRIPETRNGKAIEKPKKMMNRIRKMTVRSKMMTATWIVSFPKKRRGIKTKKRLPTRKLKKQKRQPM